MAKAIAERINYGYNTGILQKNSYEELFSILEEEQKNLIKSIVNTKIACNIDAIMESIKKAIEAESDELPPFLPELKF